MSKQFIPLKKHTVKLLAVLSLSVSINSISYAAPGDVNSINNVTNILPGTYYNTSGTPTVFNATGSGLVVGAGNTVTGQEVSNIANPAGSLTGNGGYLRFNAPGQVVQVDGTIDVRGLLSNAFASHNGGRIEVNSAFLTQNGNILANGANGGLVQMNVGSATFGPNAVINAMGANGNGGVIQVASAGPVTVQQGALLDTSGRMVGNFDTNVIDIQGSAVNIYGTLRANGTVVDGAASSGGKISLVANDENLYLGPQSRVTANGAEGVGGQTPGSGGNGGQINLFGHYSVIVAPGALVQANGGNGGNAANVVGTIKTITDKPGVSVTIGKFNLNANPDATDLNKLQPGVTQTQTIPSITKTLAAGVSITTPVITAQATYAANSSSVTVVIKQGSTVLKTFTYVPDDKSPFGVKQDTITFNATLNVNGYPPQTVAISRDFNLQTSFNASSNEPTVNLVFLPQHLGGTVNIPPTTHTEQTAIGINGGNGGKGGAINITYAQCPPIPYQPLPGFYNNGVIEAKGGNGGNGGNATSTSADITYAKAGNGGNGGDGGSVTLSGNTVPSGSGVIVVTGGTGGSAGIAAATPTGTAIDGVEGSNGLPGSVK